MTRKPAPRPGTPTGEPETTGHIWDIDLREYNNPLPRWWLYTFYVTIVWGLAYAIAYPAWPMITQATQGMLGHSARADVAAEIKRFADANAPIEAKLVATDLTAIADDPELANFTRNAGAAVFKTYCAQCHGAGAAGAKGYPNLLDNDWLWGGDIGAIHTTITHGIRNTTDADARGAYAYMPAWSDRAPPGPMTDAAPAKLTDAEVAQVVNHLLKLSGQTADAAMAAAGQPLYADNCAACHGDDGTGNRDLGAPDLTDAIWLFGGDEAALTQTIAFGRGGAMPNWTPRLSEAQIRAVAAYVHGLGGGE
ncbi:MAG: cytochrome-c oxidase, cbb3-type subunit III [Paracoccaceae bacterium]